MSGFLSRLFDRRRRIEEEVWRWVIDNHPILDGLTEEQETTLRALAERFLARKQMLLIDEIDAGPDLYASVAAQACLPVLELGLSYYRHWSTIALTSEEFDVDRSEVDSAGVVHEGIETASGQIRPLGSIFLSVSDIDASGWCDGYNVVIHEMAHVLDRGNGALDGAPLLHREMDGRRWTQVFSSAYSDLQERVTARRPRPGSSSPARSRIDPYAAEAPEEFFAVVSETFFEQPWVLQQEYPEVYDQLRAFYRQDPATRLSQPKRRRR
ncbi:M90 family metallopeptidase [Salinispira pacifica]